MPMSKILGSPNSQYRFYIETTISYPRNSQFKRLTLNGQERLYNNLFTYLKLHCPFIDYIDAKFEKSSDRRLHVHAQLHCSSNCPYSAEGAICDIVKHLSSQLPKRSQQAIQKCSYNPFLQNFCSAPFKLNYKPENADAWQNYINKNQTL